MLTLPDYLQRTRNLLNDSGASFYSDVDLTLWVNMARVQTAADGECIRREATISTVAAQRSYSWSDAVFASPASSGAVGILSVRSVARQVGDGPGQVKLFGHAWEWFNIYYVQQPAPVPGIPTQWSTLQRGDVGTFWVDPIPDDAYTLILDPVCFPGNLVLGASPETPDAVPFPWYDAVPYYAAYLALDKAQRTSDANGMFAQYRLFARRATQMTTPTQQPTNYPGGGGAQTAQQRSLVGGPAEASPRG